MIGQVKIADLARVRNERGYQLWCDLFVRQGGGRKFVYLIRQAAHVRPDLCEQEPQRLFVDLGTNFLDLPAGKLGERSFVQRRKFDTDRFLTQELAHLTNAV